MKDYENALIYMDRLFGHDTVMAMATTNDNVPSIRNINAFYNNGAIYVSSYALSQKAKDIAVNPNCALCNGLSVFKGKAKNLGNPLNISPELHEKIRNAFINFYDAHVNEADENTCIIEIKLKNALIFGEGKKFIIDFDNQTAQEFDFTPDILV